MISKPNCFKNIQVTYFNIMVTQCDQSNAKDTVMRITMYHYSNSVVKKKVKLNEGEVVW